LKTGGGSLQQNSFGEFLREKRKEHGKTQEYIAQAIGKKKMLISGMETGKNNPPQGENLENMMNALGLDDDEKIVFRTKAAFARDTLPNEIIKSVKEDERILEILYEIKKSDFTDIKYKQIKEILGGNYE